MCVESGCRWAAELQFVSSVYQGSVRSRDRQVSAPSFDWVKVEMLTMAKGTVKSTDPKGKLATARRWVGLCLVLLSSLMFLSGVSSAQDDNPLPPGMYRLEMILASVARLPFFGISKSASRSVSLIEVRSDHTELLQRHEVCDFHVLEDSAMIKMVFPDKFVAALAKHSYPIQVEKDDQGWRYRADLGIERIGYKPTSGESNLPTKLDDSSVYDWDSDGHPGATLKLSVPLLPDGELYVVQRGHSILNGRITARGRVEGSIEVRSFEHRVLGAWPEFLNRSPEIVPDPAGSRFTIVAIPQGSNCETLRAGPRRPKQKD
jgi:hypothetical protein